MTDFREFYTEGYSLADRDEAERMGRWRALGARSKADHVVALCARAGARARARWSEIGCGDGALLAELAARGLSPALDGFELSPPAAEHRAGARRRRATVEAYDGLQVPAEDGAYDLALLSHVLEHVPEPMTLLREAARVAPAVLVEVPLEDNRSARAGREARARRRGSATSSSSSAPTCTRCCGWPGCAWPRSSPTRCPTPTTRSSPGRAGSAQRRH